MRLTPYEQEELADAIARSLRLQARVLALRFQCNEPLAQHEVRALVSDAIDCFIEPRDAERDREAAADAAYDAYIEDSLREDAREQNSEAVPTGREDEL